NSCRVVVGAYDYFNVYINGKLITGNLFPPHDPLFNPPVGIIDNVFFNIDRHLVSGENVIAIEALTYTVSRTVLGAFADVLDAGLCSNLGPSSVNKKTDSVSHLGGDMSQALPVKCFVDKDNAATYPADFFDCSGGTCWRESDFDDSGAGWTFSVNGSLPLGGDPGEPLSDRIVRGGNYSNPFPIWGGDKNFNNTSHIYCRYVFTR
ncbi:hypothetical protein HYZ76_02435, partial [Candidatus Falkowbacteria bacterium]|nr:hypothetical protein [Candidatus Falkowbacteria bacterium]